VTASPSGTAGRTVHVRVPATSANLGPGFDAFGLALDLYDDVEVRTTGGGTRVEVSGEGAGEVPIDETHLILRSMRAAFDVLGEQPAGVELRCTNRIPHGRGLGSSAAAIVAGVVGARALVADGAQRLPDDAALELASALEGHPDNVAACLLGGFTLAWLDGDAARARAVRMEPSAGTRVVVFVPSEPVSTERARALLPTHVPHADAARNAGRAALLVQALTARPDLLLAATEDRLHQQYRLPAMPASAELVSRLRAEGVAAVISGAGPTVLAFVPGGDSGAVPAWGGDAFHARDLRLSAAGARTVPG
jgi:homoserine kinase